MNDFDYDYDDTETNSHTRSKTKKRGFAGMDPEEQKKIASKGGRAAHKQGVAHEWDSSEAKAAGKKGGRA